MFRDVSVSYDFKEFNGMTRITATKVVKGIPLHFEILFLFDTYAPKVRIIYFLNQVNGPNNKLYISIYVKFSSSQV